MMKSISDNFLKKKYGSIHPNFACGSFSKQYNTIMLEPMDRFILINLINFDCFENFDFCSLVLSDKGFKDFLDNYHVMYFVGLLNKNLEIKYRHLFGKQIVYPCLMLLTNYKKSLTIIETINQMHTATELENKIKKKFLNIEKNSTKK